MISMAWLSATGPAGIPSGRPARIWLVAAVVAARPFQCTCFGHQAHVDQIDQGLLEHMADQGSLGSADQIHVRHLHPPRRNVVLSE